MVWYLNTLRGRYTADIAGNGVNNDVTNALALLSYCMKCERGFAHNFVCQDPVKRCLYLR